MTSTKERLAAALDALAAEIEYGELMLATDPVELFDAATRQLRTCKGIAELAAELAEWSQRTFGDDTTRGPEGALKHLKLEADEALADPTDAEEYADCFILVIDAARRAGFGIGELIEAAHGKLQVCKAREYPWPTSATEPVMHTRTDGQ